MLKRIRIGALMVIMTLSSLCSLYAQNTPPAPYGPLPSENQLRWQQTGMYCIIHFGLNTFTNKEWGYGNVSPDKFNPTHFDPDQIVKAAKDGGFKGIIFVAKHHDGFCLWPTKATDYNISKSSWMGGKGDVVKAFEDAAHKYDMKFGLYCSPWDRNSKYYGTYKYIQIYRQQLRELWTHYGNLFEVWFDGANGGDGYYGGANVTRTIDRATYYGWDTTWAMLRKLQPGAVIFSDVGPDLRWVGNEQGQAAETSWETFTPVPVAGQTAYGPGYVDYAHSPTGTRSGKYWIPAECDVPLRPGWFYHEDQNDKVKTPEQLFNIYLHSVGRGAAMNLGLAPDMEGRLYKNDVEALKGFGDILRKTFAKNLAEGASLHASNVRGNDFRQYGPRHLLDDDRYSYWATDDSVIAPQLVLDLKGEKKFNIISISENIKLGQRVGAFAVDAWENNQWKQIAEATSIGNLRLIRLPDYVTTNKVRLRILKSPVCPAISGFGLYSEPVKYISRNEKGTNSINN